MNEDERAARREDAARWLAIAEEDARGARACLEIEPPAFSVTAYLCQQAAEKILKGMLVLAGVEFALTHDIDRLASQAQPHYPDALALLDAARSLTPWGIAYRYPGIEPIPEPLPNANEVGEVLAVIDRLAGRLRLQLDA